MSPPSDTKGLAQDERGFLQTELGSRRVAGEDRIYAPGDAGDFPVQAGVSSLLQADATAEDIAARIEGRNPAFSFDPVSMCVMEEFDKATFAQVPLRITGDPAHPVEVRPGAKGTYRVGTSGRGGSERRCWAFTCRSASGRASPSMPVRPGRRWRWG
jgi:sulfide:quinone oxidoreductase